MSRSEGSPSKMQLNQTKTALFREKSVQKTLNLIFSSNHKTEKNRDPIRKRKIKEAPVFGPKMKGSCFQNRMHVNTNSEK
jgi:hypothetical protein